MEQEKLEILRMLKIYMDKHSLEAIGYPVVDRLCLISFPKLVYEGKLIDLMSTLVQEKYLINSPKGGFSFTERGINAIRSK
jgi:hypothetical protein